MSDTASDRHTRSSQSGTHPQPNGKWTGTLPLPPGRYEYKFVVDGQWGCEPGCEHEYRGCSNCVPNEFGTMNRVLEVQ